MGGAATTLVTLLTIVAHEIASAEIPAARQIDTSSQWLT